jgi:hypothetical protein
MGRNAFVFDRETMRARVRGRVNQEGETGRTEHAKNLFSEELIKVHIQKKVVDILSGGHVERDVPEEVDFSFGHLKHDRFSICVKIRVSHNINHRFGQIKHDKRHDISGELNVLAL